MACTYTYNGRDYASKTELINDVNYDNIGAKGLSNVSPEEATWFKFYTQKRIDRTLGDIGLPKDQREATMEVFNFVAKRWATNRGKKIEDFYAEVLKDVRVADLSQGRGRTTQVGPGQYLIELATNADITTPVHELAHVFMNFLDANELFDVVQEWQKSTGNRASAKVPKFENLNLTERTQVSEFFANQFETYLRYRSKNPNINNSTLRKFAKFLEDIVLGVQDRMARLTGRTASLSPRMREIYDNILGLEMTETAASGKIVISNDPVWQRFEKAGIQAKKRTFDQMREQMAGYVNSKYGKGSTTYLSSSIQELVEDASKSPEVDPAIAHTRAVEILQEWERVGRDLKHMRPPTSVQVVAMSFAGMEVERMFDQVQKRLADASPDQIAELTQLRTELSERLDTIASALSVVRSVSGQSLGMGAHLLKRVWYSPEEVIRNFEVMNKRKALPSEKKALTEIAEKLTDKVKEIERLKNEDESLEEIQIELIADQVLQNIKQEPLYQEFLKETNTPSKKSSLRRQILDVLKKGFTGKIRELFQDGEYRGSTEEKKALRMALFSLIADEKVPTGDFLELVQSFKNSEYGQAMKFSNDKSLHDSIIAALVYSSKTYQNIIVEKPASDRRVIERELEAFDKLKQIITDSFEPKTKGPQVRLSYPEFVDQLRAAIDSLVTAASMDDSLNDAAYVRAIQLLDNIESHYNQLDIRDQSNNKALWLDMSNLDKNQVLGMVRDYEKARNFDARKKRIAELDIIIDQLQAGVYEGNLREFMPSYDAEMVLDRLDDAGVLNDVVEYAEYKKEKENERIISKIFDVLAKDSRFKADFKSIVDQTVKDLDRMGMKVSPHQVYVALMERIPKKDFQYNVQARSKAVRDEANLLKKLKKELTADNKPKDKDALWGKAQVINSLIEDLRRLVRLDHSLYDGAIDEVDQKLQNIQNTYHDIMFGPNEQKRSIASVIKALRDFESDRKLDQYKEQIKKFNGLSRQILQARDLASIPFEVMAEVGGIIPRYLDENIEEVRKKASTARRGARLNLKKKVLQDHLESIRQGNPNFDKLGQLLGNDSRMEAIDQRIAKLNGEVVGLTSRLREYYESKVKKDPRSRIMSVINVPRVAVLAGDLSFVPYQAGFTLNFLFAHPKIAKIVFGRLITGLVKETASVPLLGRQGAASEYFNKLQGQLKSDKYWDHAVRANLNLIDPLNVTTEEELQLTNILEHVGPVDMINTVLGGNRKLPSDNIVNNSTKEYFKRLRGFGTRNYANFMNSIRLEMYKSGVQKLGLTSDVPNAAEHTAREEWAEYINTLSGGARRFSSDETWDKRANSVIEAASVGFIAPRLYASVFKSMVQTSVLPHYLRRIAIRGDRYDPQLSAVYRRMHKQNMVNAFGMFAYHAIAYSAFIAGRTKFGSDDEDETFNSAFEEVWQNYLNPYSSKFLKIDIGNRVLALTPISSFARFGARMFLSPFNATDNWWEKSEELDRKNWWEHSTDFLKYRVNPALSSVMTNLVYNQDYLGRPLSDTLWDRISATFKGGLLTIWQQGMVDNYYQGTSRENVVTVPLDVMGVNAYVSNPFYSHQVKKYKDNPVGSRSPFRASYGLSVDDKLRDTRKWVNMQDQMQSKFGYWLLDELSNGRKPSKRQMQRQFEAFRVETFKQYDEEPSKRIRDYQQKLKERQKMLDERKNR